MKRLVLTFLSAAAVCAVVSDTPAAAQDTIRDVPSGAAPVTVEGYGTSIGTPNALFADRTGLCGWDTNSSGCTGPSTPAIGAAKSGGASAIAGRPSEAL